ncbi:MAG TPA: hypothetical protein VFP54_12715 [Acidimicrobiales bacterium]|nr:hypothetical protein [Acidimicrobiales bacterium]
MLSPLRHLDIAALTEGVRAESRARQHHLPPVSVYRWWARRAETVTGSVIDAVATEAGTGRLLLADPFAGGGVVALAALIRGHRVYAQDINPWAVRNLATMLSLPAPDALDAAGRRLHAKVADLLTKAYATTLSDGTPAEVAHTLRVATGACPGCGEELRLFPTATVSLLGRVDTGATHGYVACSSGHLQLTNNASKRTVCHSCGKYIYPKAAYTAGRVARCRSCSWSGKTDMLAGPGGFTWQVALIERGGAGRREIGPPTAAELAASADSYWHPSQALPAVAPGIETSVLRRHGIGYWHDLYPARQRVILEALLGACGPAADGDPKLEAALRAAVLGSVEMAGYASRWDARYLKAYETVANHRYNLTTFAAEPNVWGAAESGRGTVERRLAHIAKASVWLTERCGSVTVDGPLPASRRRTLPAAGIDARVVEGPSQRLVIPTGALDAVITDPPYADDVHYSELSDLFRAWAGLPTGRLTGDAIVRRLHGPDGTDMYQQLLTDVFREVHRALRPGGHLVLSYANREPSAWVALFNALQAAGFRAVGYQVVPSENELDHSKAGKRACALDVLLDLVHADTRRIRQWRPVDVPAGDEGAFCRVVAEHALLVGKLDQQWAERFCAALRVTKFLGRRDDRS